MQVPFFDLKRQMQNMKKEIEKRIETVLDRGVFILGPECSNFEENFAKYVGSKYSIGVASGTEAIQLALMALEVGNEDEVITTSTTAFPTAAAITSVGAKPVFIEVLETNNLIDPKKVEEKITKKTKAIIAVHLYGNSSDIDPILDICKKHKIHLIEDCAQSLGTKYKNKKTGTYGTIGCFSFYPTKNLGACGDAGMCVTNQKEIAEKIRMIRNYGETSKYVNQIKGINSRLDEIQAAILDLKLKYVDEWIDKKRKLASIYDKKMNNELIQKLEVTKNSQHTYHIYAIKCERRDELKRFLEKNGIITLIHYPTPIHKQEAYKKDYPNLSLPISEKICNEILSLPIFPEMSEEEAEYVCKTINRFK